MAVGYFTGHVSAWLVIALTVDRVMLVFKPLKAYIFCSQLSAVKVCSCIYFVSNVGNDPLCVINTVSTKTKCPLTTDYQLTIVKYQLRIKYLLSKVICYQKIMYSLAINKILIMNKLFAINKAICEDFATSKICPYMS